MKTNNQLLKNIYEGDERLVLKDSLPLEMPLCISIEPTNICNFKCVMCYHGNNESDPNAKPLKNIDWQVFEKTVADIKKWVTKTGKRIKLIKLYSLGEPLLNPEITDMIRVIKESDVSERVEITTNGSLLNQHIIEKIVDYEVDIIRVSVYSVRAERMRRVTASGIAPDKIQENVEALVRYRNGRNKEKPRVYVKMLDANTDENEEFLRIYESIADEVGIDEVFNIDLGEGNSAFQNMYQDYAEIAHKRSLASNIYDNTTQRRVCRYPFTHMTVRSDGTVIVCCADWLKELKIGNIVGHSIEELWMSKSLYELRKKMLTSRGVCFKACRECEIPFRDAPEDAIEGVSIDQFGYLSNI